MNRVLLVIGAVINVIFGLFHIFLGYPISRIPDLARGYRGLRRALNVGGTLVIFFMSIGSMSAVCLPGLR